MSNHRVIKCTMLESINPRLEALSARINAVRDPSEKARLAEELQLEVDVLLDCPNHQAGHLECQSCRLIATLRQQATELVKKAGSISRLRGKTRP